jgi:hypothetical protein
VGTSNVDASAAGSNAGAPSRVITGSEKIPIASSQKLLDQACHGIESSDEHDHIDNYNYAVALRRYCEKARDPSIF